MKKRIIVGISGASGVIYGIEFLRLLVEYGVETHLILSAAGKKNIEIETDYKADEISKLAHYSYDNMELESAISSGSFLTDGMAVVPCSIKSLSGIANSFNENMIIRGADVTLKEKRKLILMVRETPLHSGHLKLMLKASELGAHILPPIPAFYHRPKNLEDIIYQTIGKMFDYLGIEHELFKRWE